MEHLTGMAIFAKVVESRSFSKAARDLGVSKSTVSKAVARLEERFGARLLNRTTRQLSLTEVGRTFYERCSRVIAEWKAAEHSVTELSTEPRGTLRVNASLSFGFRHIAPLIPEFLEQNPEISLDIEMTDQFVDLVDGGYDLAVRIGRLSDSSMIARKLAPCRFAVCATPSYFKRHGVPSVPHELAGHRCLRYAHLATQDEWWFDGPNGRDTVHIDGPFRTNNGDALRAAALKGLGILYTPTFIVGDDLREGRLVTALDGYAWETGVYAVYPHNRHVSAKVRAFVDFLADRYGPEPYWDRGLAH